jgi:hypothetical protein
LKSNIAGGIDPQFSFYNTATASVQGSLNYRPHGPPPGGVITCGPYSKPDIGCTNETDDGDAAFLHALFFALTSDERHAVLSRTILTLYSGPGGLTTYSDSNSPLQAAWSCGKFVRAAELLRWTPSSGWNDTDTDAFNTLMYGVHIPLIYEGSGSNGCVCGIIDVIDLIFSLSHNTVGTFASLLIFFFATIQKLGAEYDRRNDGHCCFQ